jgi:hypothetical protein
LAIDDGFFEWLFFATGAVSFGAVVVPDGGAASVVGAAVGAGCGSAVGAAGGGVAAGCPVAAGAAGGGVGVAAGCGVPGAGATVVPAGGAVCAGALAGVGANPGQSTLKNGTRGHACQVKNPAAPSVPSTTTHTNQRPEPPPRLRLASGAKSSERMTLPAHMLISGGGGRRRDGGGGGAGRVGDIDKIWLCVTPIVFSGVRGGRPSPSPSDPSWDPS